MSEPTPSYRMATCPVCGQARPEGEMVPGRALRPGMAERIAKEHPDWSRAQSVCLNCMADYRAAHIRDLLSAEIGELRTLDDSIVERLSRNEAISTDVDADFTRDRSFGERIADKVAQFGGSWTFITLFLAILVVWMAVNSLALASRAFDPYPFILLNLVLSCIAALQAPIIMMSQRRQENRDRLRSQSDYLINLKAELEVRLLHEKLDHVLRQQWDRMTEIQTIQIDMLEEALGRIRRETVAALRAESGARPEDHQGTSSRL